MGGQFSATSQFYLYGKKYCTRNGWLAASKKYAKPDILTTVSLTGRVYIVTGANGGIGYGIASYLAERGGSVYMFCRSLERGSAKRDEIISKTGNQDVHLVLCDCSLEADVRRAWQEFTVERQKSASSVRMDALVCNAGALAHTLRRTSEGVEETVAAHLIFGTYLLTTLAMPALEHAGSTAPPSSSSSSSSSSSVSPSRVVVVSSGGMYNTPVPDWETLVHGPAARRAYEGNMAYASAKRAQVVLCEEWTKAGTGGGVVRFVSCHPGWVDTEGVQGAYGENKAYLAPLRSIWEGAEGICWLAVVPPEVQELEGGAFYLDRSPCLKHIAGPFFSEGTFTKNTAQEVADLMRGLRQWSSADTRPKMEAEAAAAAAST